MATQTKTRGRALELSEPDVKSLEAESSAAEGAKAVCVRGGPIVEGTCPMPDIAQLIGGKWKLIILQILIFQGMRRFNELRRQIDGITQTMLTNQLRALERDGLVSRKVYAEIPPRVEYRATQRALDLQEMFHAMHAWWIKGEEEDVKGKPS